MTDVHSPAIRSKNMQAIRGKNTSPERKIRRLLHSLGFRFRLHNKKLPSKPDIVLAKYKAVILVHGCFWHGHNCHLFKLPRTRTEFWKHKIKKNQLRDINQVHNLEELGYKILIVWECSLKGKFRLTDPQLKTKLADWLMNETNSFKLFGEEV